MRFRVRNNSHGKQASPFVGAIMMTVFVVVIGFILYTVIDDDIDLLKNGKIASAKVVSVKEREKRKKKGNHYEYITVYDHLLSLDGRQTVHEFKERHGPTVEVYYSTVNPGNLVLKLDNHPYQSMNDVLFNWKTAVLGFFWLVSLGMVLFFLRQHLRGRDKTL